uniref:Uncharacterized protein n=1 Tax=Arundo donax TaxID=35708 RepID=A0A0A8YRW7_ARUDO
MNRELYNLLYKQSFN